MSNALKRVRSCIQKPKSPKFKLKRIGWDSFLEITNGKPLFVSNMLRGEVLESLTKDVFEERTSYGNGIFSVLGQWFCP